MPRQPEGRLKKRIKDYLTKEGAVVFAIHGGDNPFQEVGIPDLLACLEGRFIGVECKLPGEKLRPVQEVVIRRLEKAGALVVVATSVEDVEAALRRTARKGRR